MNLRFVKVHDNCTKTDSLRGLTVKKKEFLKNCSLDELENYNKSINKDSPFSGNGIYFTGDQPDGSFFWVVDFDRAETSQDDTFNEFVAKCIKILEIPKEDLYIVKTGSGGYHFYFEVTDVPGKNFFKTKNFIFLNELKYTVKSVDFLGVDGLVFTPGCDFRDKDNGKYPPHKDIYTIFQNDHGIPTVSFQTAVKLIVYIQDLCEIRVEKDVPQSTRPNEGNPNLTDDELEIIYALPVRAAFKFILTGKIQVTNETFVFLASTQGKAKFRIWMAFFREMFTKVNGFEDNIQIFYKILTKTQSEFDLKKTMQNLHQAKGKPPVSKHLYDRYFEIWSEDILREENRVKELKKEAEKLWIKEVAEAAMNAPHHIGYLREDKEFFYFTGKVYELNTDKVKSIIIDMISDLGKTGTRYEVLEVLAYIQAKNHHSAHEFDKNESYLIFENGIYDLETRSMIDFNPGYLAFEKFKYPYDPLVDQIPDKTLAYLRGLGWNDAEIERFLYISKEILEKRLPKMKLFIVCWGVPDSGKTLWGEKLANLIGEPNKDWCLLRFEKFESRFALEQTRHARFVILDDVSVNAMENSQTYGIFKNLTGGRTYELEGKGKSAITQLIKFSIYVSCNMLFRLPNREEIGALLNRAFVFEFQNSHCKEPGFANTFLNDQEDNSRLLSYLINLEPKRIIDFSRIPIPDTPTSKQESPMEYWFKHSNPIYYLCANYMRQDVRNKVKLNSILQVFQAIANQRKLNIDIFSKESIDDIKNYCKRNLHAVIPRAKMDINGEYQTWIYGAICFGAVNEPITVADSIEPINISDIDNLAKNYDEETKNMVHEQILERKKYRVSSIKISELTDLLQRDVSKAINDLLKEEIIKCEYNGEIFF